MDVSRSPLIQAADDDSDLDIVGECHADIIHPSRAPPPPAQLHIYTRRWYILALFSMIPFTQGLVWNTWSPINNSAKAVFGWDDSTFALLNNWGCITFIISSVFWSWLLDTKGLRIASVLTMALVAMGAGLRCITSKTPAATWLIHAGHIANGFGGPVAMSGGPLLSAVWFPAEQRTTATGVAAASIAFGNALAFIIGPLLVSDIPAPNSTNITGFTQNHNTSIDQVTGEVMRLMYYEFGLCALVFLLMVIYFPPRPPSPPSISAGIQRVDFKKGLLQLLRHKQFWMIGLPYAISGGVYACYEGVLGVLLTAKGISQDTAGWVGFISMMAGTLLIIIVSGIADHMKRQMKFYLISLNTAAGACMLVFSLSYQGVIPLSKGLLYGTQIPMGMFLCAGIPLYFELCCETTYPIAEGVTNGFLTWASNLSGLIFLLVIMINNIGKVWVNWCLTGCIALCIPVLATVREQFGRLDTDTITVTD